MEKWVHTLKLYIVNVEVDSFNVNWKWNYESRMKIFPIKMLAKKQVGNFRLFKLNHSPKVLWVKMVFWTNQSNFISTANLEHSIRRFKMTHLDGLLIVLTLANRPEKFAKLAIFLCKIFFFEKKSLKLKVQEFGRKWPIL